MMRSETFRWKHKIFDICRLLSDLERGDFSPELIALDLTFIAT
jgi:hypothetical protein